MFLEEKKEERKLAKIHSLLGNAPRDLMEEILLSGLEDFKNVNEALEFIRSFNPREKVFSTIKERAPKLDFSYIDKYFDKRDLRVCSIFSQEYPKSLRNIPSPPQILYLEGHYMPNFKIAVVGARKASLYALQETKKIVAGLVENGVSIVSGMALGIDRIAHEASLDSQAASIGVLGSGIDIIYPRLNADLYAKMRRGKNLLISEYPLGFPPSRYTFPQRNRIISGLSDGLLITEGSLTSGSMITAGHANEQGIAVYALPGLVSNPNTKGVHELIRDGAQLITSAEDILTDLYPMLKIRQEHKNFLNLNDIELSIVEKLQANPQSLEELLLASKKSSGETIRTISILEIKGIIKKEINNKYFVII